VGVCPCKDKNPQAEAYATKPSDLLYTSAQTVTSFQKGLTENENAARGDDFFSGHAGRTCGRQ
jgi:hypothetical protein